MAPPDRSRPAYTSLCWTTEVLAALLEELEHLLGARPGPRGLVLGDALIRHEEDSFLRVFPWKNVSSPFSFLTSSLSACVGVGEETPYRGPDRVHFLQVLLRKLLGKLMVIWNEASIHRNSAVKDFLFFLAEPGTCIWSVCLLTHRNKSPQEGVWNLLKRRERKNVCARDLKHLTEELIKTKERLRHHKAVLRQCIVHAGLFLSFLHTRSIIGRIWSQPYAD